MYPHRGASAPWNAQVFVPTSEVDLVWEEVVRALWEGKLGATAKVSGAGPHSSGSHVICVYVDPFWEEAQHAQRAGCWREAVFGSPTVPPQPRPDGAWGRGGGHWL